MNRTLLSKIVIFAAGAAMGSAVTWKLVKDKYEQIAREEIESVKEVFSRLDSNRDSEEMVVTKVETSEEDDEDEPVDNVEKGIYQKVVRGLGYSNDEDEEDDDVDKPYVISPEEFGERGYAEISLTYYEDGIVANDRGKIVSNVDELIGADFASHYGEYEDDSVFVRNDKLRIDYEILKVYDNFGE